MDLILWIALFIVCPPLALLLLGIKVFGKLLKLYAIVFLIVVVLTAVSFIIH